MIIKSLIDNKSISNEYKSKHGLSLYIETTTNKILFDLGPNHLFLENAKKLGVNIEDIDMVVISHGHKDHGGGIKYFLENNKKGKVYINKSSFMPYYTKVLGVKHYVGLDKSFESNDRIILCSNNYKINDNLILFADVPKKDLISKSNDSLFMKINKEYVKDTFNHEQNLIINDDGKNILVAGCAHKGITNILSVGENICNESFDYVIGGFHLFNPVSKKYEDNELITSIGFELNKRKTKYYTCHCTGTNAFKILKETLKDKINYLSAGTTIEL
ncbi:MAG: MBL fold metallo-hydrolase [Clostridium paraputrificum]